MGANTDKDKFTPGNAKGESVEARVPGRGANSPGVRCAGSQTDGTAR